MDERTRQTISNIFRSMENNSRNWIVNRKFHPLDRFSYLKTRYRNYWRLETNFRASFAQSVSIKKRFVKRFTAPGCFCIPQRDSSSFVVKLKYIRGVAHTNPPFVSGPLLLIAKVARTNLGREIEYRVYETTGHSINYGSRKFIGSRIDKRKLHGLIRNGCSRVLCEILI